MSRHEAERLAAAWVSPEVSDAVSSVAASEGVTKSDLIRDGLVTRLLAFAKPNADGEAKEP